VIGSGRTRAEFERFVAANVEELLRIGYLVTGDRSEAEDLVQEALLRLARRWPRVRRMRHQGAYARRVLANLAIDGVKRRTRRHSELELGQRGISEQPQVGVAGAAERSLEARSELLEGLGTLPPRQRVVLVLRYFEDLSEAQTAELLGCSLGTVKSTASRGLERLRAAIEAPARAGVATHISQRDRKE
jgi:RNA polymerase sigma-70 factor (sigma-E family)